MSKIMYKGWIFCNTRNINIEPWRKKQNISNYLQNRFNFTVCRASSLRVLINDIEVDRYQPRTQNDPFVINKCKHAGSTTTSSTASTRYYISVVCFPIFTNANVIGLADLLADRYLLCGDIRWFIELSHTGISVSLYSFNQNKFLPNCKIVW